MAAMASKCRGELADLHLALLKLEQREEKKRQKQLMKGGTTALELVVTNVHTENDIYLLTLGPKCGKHGPKKRMPQHCIEKRSQVSISKSPVRNENVENDARQRKPKAPSAVVIEITPFDLTLAFSFEPKIWKNIALGETVFIRQMGNADHAQLSQAMKWLKTVGTETETSEEPAIHVVRVMFKEKQHVAPEAFHRQADRAVPVNFIKRELDASQRQAVRMALRPLPLTVIHGPPGTGKTTTIVEVILQHVERGQRVLVCAPSNKAVDNLLEGLWKQTKNTPCKLSMNHVLRLGNLVRMEEKHRRFSPRLQADKCMKRKRLEATSNIHLPREREAVLATILRQASVVMSTLTSVRSVELNGVFDLLVIDECGQATEAACWLAIPFARKVLLAGDPCQLPPTILSQEAARRGLAVSLMERQMELHGEGVVHMLDTQYRMHELIQAWSSRHLYGGRLRAAPAVGSRLLTGLPGVRSTNQTRSALMLTDTAGHRLRESRSAKTTSYHNVGEANLILEHARYLVQAGLPAKDIGVITPYKQQVTLIDSKMRDAGLDDVEVNSVDGYQGREKEAILLSLVRSNGRRQVGFVGDLRRLNVAVTRARRHLFVICDTVTVCRNESIRSLVHHLEQSGEARSTGRDSRPRDDDKHFDDDDDSEYDDDDDDYDDDDEYYDDDSDSYDDDDGDGFDFDCDGVDSDYIGAKLAVRFGRM